MHEYSICHNAPPISHLLFADDSIIFCSASKDEAEAIKSILYSYEVALGQKARFDKPNVMFEKGIPADRKNDTLLILDIREVLSYDKYLELPTRIKRSKNKVFMPLKDRICKRITGRLSKNLSWVGREVLVKAVVQAVPTYAMSIFKLPSNFTHSIQSSICNYWWGHEKRQMKNSLAIDSQALQK